MINNELSTKELIQETALDLFQQQGYEEVTIIKICEACGITKRTFYYHFKSKSELLGDIIGYWGIKAERLLNTFATENRSIDILWELMRVYCTHTQKYGTNIMRHIYINMLENGDNVRFPYKMYLYDLAVSLLEKAQKNGEISTQSPPDTLAYILYHAFRSISISWASEGGTYNLEEEYRKSFDIIVGLH